VDAAERIVRGYGRDDVHVAIVGHGDAQAAIGRAVDERRLGERVELTGPVDDDLVRAYLSTADVCVNVDTRNEMNDRAAMRKVLEYLAMGRPVVQFPLGEMQRLCGDAAVYARDGDTADMAARVVELLDDEPRRRRLGEAGARRMWDGLMWPQQIPALLAAVELGLRRQAAAPRWREVGRTFTRRRLNDAPRRT